MKRALLVLTAGVTLAACFDFTRDRAVCDQTGPCRAASDGGLDAGGDTHRACDLSAAIAAVPTTGPCSPDGGFCWEYPPLTGNGINSLWSDCHDIWAAAERGTVLHFDGVRWHVLLDLGASPEGASHPLRAVTGNAEGALVVAHAGFAAFLRADGGARELSPPGCNGTCNLEVADVGHSQFWVAGWGGPLATLNAAGVGAVVETSPPLYPRALVAVSDQEAWTTNWNTLVHVLDGGVEATVIDGGVHGDGNDPNGVTTVSLGPDGQLWLGVEYSSQVFVADSTQRPLVFRAFTPPASVITSLVTTASGERVIGSWYAPPVGCAPSLQCRTLGPADLRLASLYSPPGTDVVLGGSLDNGLYLKGSADADWQAVAAREPDFHRVVTLRDGGVVALSESSLLERGADGRWVRRLGDATATHFTDAWAGPDGKLWVTTRHDSNDSSPPLFLFDLGTGARTVPYLQHEDGGYYGGGLPDVALTAIDGSDGGVWAVGVAGDVFRLLPSGDWRRLPTSGTAALRDVYASETGVAFAVGDGDTLVRLEGDTVTALPTPNPGLTPKPDWRAISGVAGEHFFVVGDPNEPWEYDGGWTPVALNPRNDPIPGARRGMSVLAVGTAGELWVGKSDGVLYHRDVAGHVDWRPTGQITEPGNNTPANLESLTLSGGRLFIAGQGGALTSIPAP